MATSTTVEYAKSLALLEGGEFQVEVSTHLGTQVVGFQVVPSKPQGDAGLDGMSHGGERGYCCYGPEHDSFKTTKTLVNAIVKKFTSDLRRLFELDFEKKTLVRKTNKELSTILPSGCKLKQIYLVVNWFESHRVLGPIGRSVQPSRWSTSGHCNPRRTTATKSRRSTSRSIQRFS